MQVAWVTKQLRKLKKLYLVILFLFFMNNEVGSSVVNALHMVRVKDDLVVKKYGLITLFNLLQFTFLY